MFKPRRTIGPKEVYIKLSEDLFREIWEEARRVNMTPAQFCREAVIYALENMDKRKEPGNVK